MSESKDNASKLPDGTKKEIACNNDKCSHQDYDCPAVLQNRLAEGDYESINVRDIMGHLSKIGLTNYNKYSVEEFVALAIVQAGQPNDKMHRELLNLIYVGMLASKTEKLTKSIDAFNASTTVLYCVMIALTVIMAAASGVQVAKAAHWFGMS